MIAGGEQGSFTRHAQKKVGGSIKAADREISGGNMFGLSGRHIFGKRMVIRN